MKKGKNSKQKVETESISGLEEELRRVKHNSRFRKLLRNSIYTLAVVASCAVIIAVFFLPVMRIYGNAMSPTLSEGDIVVAVKSNSYKTGDVVGVYYGSKLLIKRVIATDGQWVDMDADGNVYVYDDVKGEPLDEPYLSENMKAYGETNIAFPYQVPPESVFVMGDNRASSIDSRNTSVGCIEKDNVAGKIFLRIWPLSELDFI